MPLSHGARPSLKKPARNAHALFCLCLRLTADMPRMGMLLLRNTHALFVYACGIRRKMPSFAAKILITSPIKSICSDIISVLRNADNFFYQKICNDAAPSS